MYNNLKGQRYGTTWDERSDETANGKLMVDFEKECLIRYASKASEILDVGGGTGIHASFLQNQGFKIELVDIDTRALIKASKSGINCYKLSGLEISSLNNKYDLVYCLDVPFLIGAKFLEFLDEIKKTLNVNGVFILNFMPKYSYKNIFKKIFKFLKKSETNDYYYYSYGELKEILTSNKFIIIENYSYSWLPFPVNSDSRIIGWLYIVERILRKINMMSFAPRIMIVSRIQKEIP